MNDLKPFLKKVLHGKTLNQEESEKAFSIIVSKKASESQIASFLSILHFRGESFEEILGAVIALRKKMILVGPHRNAIDICGTGGDCSNSYNISTASAFVVAGVGVKVAKHGNSALSSKSGSSDVLQKLGINIHIDPKYITYCIDKVGLGFIFAPNHHHILSDIKSIREELGTRTIFNILGPLLNPACVQYHLIGVSSYELMLPIAKILQKLKSVSFWIVFGDGLDELTTTGKNHVISYENKKFSKFIINSEDINFPKYSINSLKGGSSEENAESLRELLLGKKGAYRDIVILNSAAAFVVSRKAKNLKEGIKIAKYSIDSYRAKKILDHLICISKEKRVHL